MEASPAADGSTGPAAAAHAPAWLVSLLIHMLVALSGFLLVGRTTPQRGIQTEPDRSAAIALVQRAGGQTQYFSEDEAHSLNSAEETAAAGADGDGSPAAAYPSDDSPPVLADLGLPTLPGRVAAGESLVAAPKPGSGRRGPIVPSGMDDAAILAADAATPREQLPTGPTARLALFGSAQAEGRSFVFLIDRSQSMGGSGLGAIQTAAEELQAQITALSAEQTVQAIAYNQSTAFLGGRELIPASDANKQRLIQFVANIAAFGQTEHVRALVAALKLKPEVIFLLTDGGDPLPTATDLRLIREQAGGRTSIHTLHFGRGEAGAAAAFLQQLAAENRGSYTYIDMNLR